MLGWCEPCRLAPTALPEPQAMTLVPELYFIFFDLKKLPALPKGADRDAVACGSAILSEELPLIFFLFFNIFPFSAGSRPVP